MRLKGCRGARGAYGLRLLGLPDEVAIDDALVEAGEDWPAVLVRIERGSRSGWAEPFASARDGRTLPLPRGARAVIDRRNATATLISPERLDGDWLVNPGLAYIGSAFSSFLGRQALRAGAFIAGGGAWAVIGGPESGKSATLAWMALSGQQVLADDLLVLDGRTAFAGPRSIDLPHAVAEQLSMNGEARPVDGGERRRFTAARTEAEHPLKGLFVLTWGDGPVDARRISPRERYPLLMEHLHPGATPEQVRLLELLNLPAFELTRPKEPGSLPTAAAAMVRVAEAHRRALVAC